MTDKGGGGVAEKVGSYRVTRILGKGGFSKVKRGDTSPLTV